MDYAAMEAVADLADTGIPPHEAELMARFVGVPAEELEAQAPDDDGSFHDPDRGRLGVRASGEGVWL